MARVKMTFQGLLKRVMSGLDYDSLTITSNDQTATIRLNPGSTGDFEKGMSVDVSISESATLFNAEPKGKKKREEEED
jgi:hypothetical protein